MFPFGGRSYLVPEPLAATVVLAADTRRHVIEPQLIQGFFPLDTEKHHVGNVDKTEWSDRTLGIEPSYASCGAQGSRASLESKAPYK